MKNKQLKTKQLSTQTFSPDKIRNKSHQNFSTMLFASLEIYYLNDCCLIHIIYPKYMGNGIQATVKANKPSFMTVSVHGFHNDAMTCMLQSGESVIYGLFLAWVIFMGAIFSILNLKPDYEFLPYSMPEVFNKTGHGLTDIIIA